MDLEHVGCVCESLLVAEEGLLDPWVRAGSKMALQRRVLRLGKPPRRWKTPSFADSVKRKIKEVSFSLSFWINRFYRAEPHALVVAEQIFIGGQVRYISRGGL